MNGGRSGSIRFRCLLLAAIIGSGCGGGSRGSDPTLGAAEGYLYVNTNCDSTSEPAYMITDSPVPPLSYEAVADASVFMTARTEGEFRRATTKTGADGRFAVRDMPPGPYLVQVLSAGLDGYRYFSPVFTATLESGRTTKHFETSLAGSFMAYGTYDCDDANWPFSWQSSSGGARQALSRARVEMERSVKCRVSAETDADGHIVLNDLQRGVYAVTVPVEACGSVAVCFLDVGESGTVEDAGCESWAATATSLAPPAALRSGP
jgi:hypothetical protein